MPSINVIAASSSTTGGGVPTDTGTAFVAGATDQGPPPSGGAQYVRCLSLTDYTTAFGARSSTSAALYDWLDEFFRDGGSEAYVVRVTDNTSTTAALTLSDVTPHPTVVVSALTPGTAGNGTYVVVTASTAATFTANTASSTALANISSFANLGVGTPITGAGIPANTYIVGVNIPAETAVMSASATATATAVTITPGTITILVEDSAGDILETHGPYSTTAQLFADASSQYVAFSQSAGSGFTSNLPAASAGTALTGGTDANDLTDATAVSALALFPASLGPGTVALPGKTSTTAWAGIDAHCQTNNRWGAKDVADNASAAAVASAVASNRAGSAVSYGVFTVGQALLPGINGGPIRYAAGSSCVAALRAQVAQTNSQNQAPCGVNWGLSYPLGWTEYFGPAGAAGVPAGSYTQADVNTLEAAGVNVFANLSGVLCLYGFVSPVPESTDATYWQASAAAERMALVADCQQAALPFQFQTIDGAGNLITAFTTALKGVIARHWSANALYGDTASDAGDVLTAGSVNTPATAAAGQLNALLEVRISPYADTVTVSISTIPVTQSVI